MSNTLEYLDRLVTEGIISAEDSTRLAKRFKENSRAILNFLTSEGIARRSELGNLWGEVIGYTYVDLNKTILQEEILQILPASFAKRHKILPLFQFGDAVTTAMFEPNNKILIEEAQKITGRAISPVFAFAEEIEDAIEIHFRSTDSVRELSGQIDISSMTGGKDKVGLEELKTIAGDEAVINFTQELLLLGIKEKASDIHIEPSEESIRIRFRIDGVLQEKLKLDKTLLKPLISRLKIMAGADITETRKPQDGRITLPLSNQSIEFRFSSVPTIYGEKVVLRILGQIQTHEIPILSELDLSRSNMDKLKRVIGAPNGIFFVTGPTGSGKTTTLYAALHHLNKPGVNIVTIEDPVEYRLAGITQVQVNLAIGLDFVSALRSFLRQDPDIILVGEIRDSASAKTAAQAALTGHLVLSTIHTNSALQAITRLIEIGVEPFLIAPSIIGVMAQRLVRRVCEECKERYEPTFEVIDRIFTNVGDQKIHFYRVVGCPQCNYTGYRGRIAIHEIVVIDDDFRDLIGQGTGTSEIQEWARKHGSRSMRHDGIKKILRGLTTLEEIDRVTFVEEE